MDNKWTKKIEELEEDLREANTDKEDYFIRAEELAKKVVILEEEIRRLNRHIDMQNLTISEMKSELAGIPKTTPYSDTAE